MRLHVMPSYSIAIGRNSLICVLIRSIASMVIVFTRGRSCIIAIECIDLQLSMMSSHDNDCFYHLSAFIMCLHHSMSSPDCFYPSFEHIISWLLVSLLERLSMMITNLWCQSLVKHPGHNHTSRHWCWACYQPQCRVSMYWCWAC
jgi:hypothetical protein